MINTTTNEKMSKTTKQTRKNKDWLSNPDTIKTPKVFQVTMIRDKNGLHMVGGESKYLKRKNQHRNEWVSVDTRAFASVLRKSKIICK
jgi:phage antirepressor YoqD-like protein